MISIYKRLLEVINEEKESFDTLIDADNVLGLNVTSDDVINYLEFASLGNKITNPIIGNIIITEGDVLSVLKVLDDLCDYEGTYILYINGDNIGINTYLVSRVNKIYQELGINIVVKIDYSENYNSYLEELVTLIGSEEFINETQDDFSNSNKIIV